MTLFLKLGGSLITDKTAVSTIRPDVLNRVCTEIAQARTASPDMRLILGHGSGSFGHVEAAKYSTRDGVGSAAQWHGFAAVSHAALNLNQLVRTALMAANVPAMSVSPSGSITAVNGQIANLAFTPLRHALKQNLVPLVHGDVAFDTERGGTIVSTEEVMSYIATRIQPDWLLLAGEVAGVLDENGDVVPEITPDNFDTVRKLLGGSRGTDVTGGMVSKVSSMLALAQAMNGVKIRIFSGLEAGNVAKVLQNPNYLLGTVIRV